jgi:putative transposase
MQLVEKHIVVDRKDIEDICIKSKLLYNQSLYYLRQSLFGNIEKFSEYKLTGLFAEYNEEVYRALPAQTSQQIIKLLFKNWKSYWASIKDWKKSPTKYLGKPKLPKYKKETSIVVFTAQQVRLKDGYIHFPKNTIEPIQTKVDNICQVRIIPLANCFKIEIVYEKEITDLNLPKDNVLSLDLGLNNFAAAISNVGLQPFLVNGRTLKSFNHWYNKKKAKLQSFIWAKGTSKRIGKLTHYRNCFVEDKMHKISRFIVDYCVTNKIGTIVIGKNKQWKCNINLGGKTNQKFTELPHAKLIQMIEYKSKLVGINVDIPEESYTSKIDHLSFEEMKKQEIYLGKRKKRGLFQSSIGKLLNADINGAIGIARKVLGNSFVKTIVHSGNAFLPYKINIL